MPLTFNGAAQTITWSGGALSLRVLWSRYVDWLEIGDNSKHPLMMETVGLNTPDIPLYLILNPGVIIVVTDNTVVTPIYDGVLKVPDSHNPFGGAIVNVRYEAPGIAIGYSSSGSTGPTAAEVAAEVLAQLQATAIPVNVSKMNGAAVIGDGSEANMWRGASVSP